MKKVFFTLLLTAVFSLSGAELLFEINKQGSIALVQCQMLGFSGIGLDRFVGYSFNGRDSLFWFETLKKEQLQKEFTIVLTAAVHSLPPEKKVVPLFLRPGFHNCIAIDSSGVLSYSIWYLKTDGTKGVIKIKTAKSIRIGKGRLNRIVVTAETLANDQLRARLWYNGGLVGEKTVNGKGFFKYSKNIYIGSAPKHLTGFSVLDGVIRSVQICNNVLPENEIIKLR